MEQRGETGRNAEYRADDAMKKAESVLKKHCIFNDIKMTDSVIPPLNNARLKQKERKAEREKTAGRGWGDMPKAKMTEELKADLRALQLKNFIYKDRFFKAPDTKQLPKYVQIGTIVEDKWDPKDASLTKKEKKGSIAQQFLRDDAKGMFSKRKYEKVNDRLRRMGTKKRQLRVMKNAAKKKAKIEKKSKAIQKKKGKKC